MKITDFFDKTFWKFIAVGIANTLVGTGVMFVAYNFFGLSYWISSASNYIIGSIVSYVLNKHFTFKNTDSNTKTLIKFIINISLCYLLAYGIAKPFVRFIFSNVDIKIQENLAMLAGMCFFVAFNYVGQRFFTFKQTPNDCFTEKKTDIKKKILTVKLSSLGDVLLFTPVLPALVKKEPNAQIFHLVAKSCSLMLSNNPHLTKIIETDDLGVSKNKLSNAFILFKLFFQLKPYHFDEVYIFHRNTILLTFFQLLGIKKIHIWSKTDNHTKRVHFCAFKLTEHRLYRHLKMIDPSLS
ncbi:MAG: GtrA family protein, partial [Treponemataceae bacterium]